MAYTIYQRKVWRSSSPVVSINLGRIYMNAAIARLFHSFGAERALLLFDREQRKLAVRPVTKRNKGDKRAYCIDYHPNGIQAAISAKKFLKHLGWDGVRYHLDAHWDEENWLLEFTMPDWGNDRMKLLPMEALKQRLAKTAATGS